MEKRELTCIGCPLGCGVTVTLKQNQVTDIAGHTCKRGGDYARKEVLNPTRIVTSIVFLDGNTEKMLPVKTKQDIPKNMIFKVIHELQNIRAKAPIKIGDVILKNAAQTGVDVVAAKEVL